MSKLTHLFCSAEGTHKTPSGNRRKKRTTRGWKLFVRWKDGSGDWVKLKDLKDSYPVDLANCAIRNNTHDEPAFAWWVPHVQRKRKAIIQKVKSKYWSRTHKHGIKVPQTMDDAIQLDNETPGGENLWQNAIKEEMKNNRISFKTYKNDVKELVGYQEITAHLVFDI